MGADLTKYNASMQRLLHELADDGLQAQLVVRRQLLLNEEARCQFVKEWLKGRNLLADVDILSMHLGETLERADALPAVAE